MKLYEWVYQKGKVAEGVFCSEDCATAHYYDRPYYADHGAPSLIEEPEASELVDDYECCSGCGKSLKEAGDE